jgi:hypothetical protein
MDSLLSRPRRQAPWLRVMVNSTSGGGHISHHKNGSVGKYTKNIVDFPLTQDGYHTDEVAEFRGDFTEVAYSFDADR